MQRPRKPKRKRPNLTIHDNGKEVNMQKALSQVGLKSYLEKNGMAGWDMYFCRGKSCPRGPAAKQLSKQRCGQCVKGGEGETLGSLMRRIDVLNSQ